MLFSGGQNYSEPRPQRVPSSYRDTELLFNQMLDIMHRDDLDREVPSPSSSLTQFDQDSNLMYKRDELYDNCGLWRSHDHGEFSVNVGLGEDDVLLLKTCTKNYENTSTSPFSNEVNIKKELMEMSELDNCGAYFDQSSITTPSAQIKIEDGLQDRVWDDLLKEIQHTCLQLGISADPKDWNKDDVHKWIAFQLTHFHLPMVQLEYFNVDGVILCGLSEYDFAQMLPIGHDGAAILAAQLEVWKMAIENDPARQWMYQPESATSPHPVPTPSPEPAQVPVYQFPTLSTSPVPSPAANRDINTPSPVDNTFGSFNIGMLQWHTLGSPEMYEPAPTTSPHPVPTPSPDPAHVLGYTLPNFSTPVPSPAANRDINTPSPVDNTLRVPSIIPNLSSAISDYSSDSGALSEDDNSVDGLELRSTRQSSHSHIQLWQFLKELLLNPQIYRNCIRWQERSEGTFKIEDSVQVAKLWGKRKNRPAMNYDKLSRSIRQYYKKGIMRKTVRSQRLVYQFCPPYSLQCQ